MATASKAAGQAIYAGRGLEEFKWRLEDELASSGKAERRMSVIGNSVARQNGFGTSRAFLRALAEAYPAATFSKPQYAKGVQGGFEPSHLMHCGSSAYQGSDLILVQYEYLAKKDSGRELLETLLTEPSQPLVMAVKHCRLPQVEMLSGVTESKWAKHYNMPSTDKLFERMRQISRGDTELMAGINITFVDSCSLMRMLLSGDDDLGIPAMSIEDIEKKMFPMKVLADGETGRDNLHQSPAYSSLQGCLAATALIQAAPRPPSTTTTTPDERQRSGGRGRGGRRGFCLQAGTDEWDRAAKVNRGWEHKTGGADGTKQWMQSSTVGARVSILLPSAPSSVSLEYYTHESLPMGTIKATVAASRSRSHPGGGLLSSLVLGRRHISSVVLDGKCGDCLSGQGFYSKGLLAGDIQARAGESIWVELELITPEGGWLARGKAGGQASIVSIIGE